MKDPKSLFPLLFASSWLGNLVLTVLAFYLAFTHDGPLTPLVFLTVAVCILAGNALPIGVYLILVRWRTVELRAEAAEAAVRVRDALKRSEEVLGRLDEAEGSLAKSVLLARQVPERVKEVFAPLEALAEKLEKMEVGGLSQALQEQADAGTRQAETADSLRAAIKELESGLAEVRQSVQGMPKAMERLLEQGAANRGAQPAEEVDPSLGERLDLVFETMEGVQDSLDSLLQRVVELKIQATPPPFATPSPFPPLAAEAVEKEQEKQLEQEKEPKPARKARAKPVEESAQAEMVLEPAPQVGDEPPQPPSQQASDGKTRLVAHAMIGMHNRLFIRGDEPWLSWDDGAPMELVGIGEFAWVIDDLKEPIEVAVLVNDEFEAEDGPVRLEPGQLRRIHPRFPKA